MHRWDIINFLIRKNNYKSYLEIGYFKGWSFDNVNCDHKTAVDPNPSKDRRQETVPYGYVLGPVHDGVTDEVLSPGYVYKMTSDDFFNAKNDGVKYDIVFIDGLHEAKQVYFDIMNSLQHLSPGGTIVLHDCNPPTLLHATTGDAGGNWNGDVYKAFVKFRFAHPEYDTYTIDTDWGCGVIHTPADEETTYIDSLFRGEHIDNFLNDWDRFDMHRKDLLNLISVEEFIKKNHEETKDHNVPA